MALGYEAKAIASMSDSEWESYLNDAVLMSLHSPGLRQHPALDPALFRSLMNVIRCYVAEEEADLAKLEAKGKDTKDHAWWATIQSYPVGSFLSQHRYGVDVSKL